MCAKDFYVEGLEGASRVSQVLNAHRCLPSESTTVIVDLPEA